MIGIKIERDHFASILVLAFSATSKLNMFCIIFHLQENTLPIYEWIVALSTTDEKNDEIARYIMARNSLFVYFA